MPQQSAETIIQAEKLAKKYGDLVAVDGIDFGIRRGETFGFLGPNGAGKTTTMKMIYCFMPPTWGKLSVAGYDVTRNPREIKALLGVVPQEDSLDPDLTVYGNLLAYSRYYDISPKVAHERIVELLDFMQLTEKKNTIIYALSGGMKRRLVLARGLINSPQILVLDEPTTGLDPQARHLVWQKLRHLKSQGLTILLTTHYMEEASLLCDRLVIMNAGKILDSGSPQELVKKVVGQEVLEIYSADDALFQKVRSSVGPRATAELFGDVIYLYSNDGQPILSELPRLGIENFLHRRATLEDVFLRLAGRTLKE